MNYKSKVKHIPLIILGILVFGCASLEQKNSDSPELLLEKRTHALMQARVSGDWEKAYSFFNEAYKKKTSITPFTQSKSAKVISYTIEKLDITSETNAQVLVTSVIMINMKPLKAPTLQNWVYENGNWFLFMKPSTNPFGS